MAELSAGEARAAQDPLLRHNPQERREAAITYRVRRRVDVGVFEEWPRPEPDQAGSEPQSFDEHDAVATVLPPPPPPAAADPSGGGIAVPPTAPGEPEWMPGHEPDHGGGRRRWLSGGLARLVLAGLVVGGVGIWGAVTSADRDSETGEIVAAGDLNVDKIEVGDCVNLPDAEEFNQVHAVPCAEPHDAQVYWLRQLPPGDYPGLDELDSMAETQCDAAFASLPQAIVDDLDYGYTWFTPTESGWRGGDRVVNCLAGRVDGTTTTGSLLAS